MTENGRKFRDWVMRQTAGGTTATCKDEDSLRFELPAATAEVNFYPYTDDQEIVELRVARTTDGDATFFLHFALDDDLDHARMLFGQMVDVLAEEGEREVVPVLLTCTSAMTTSYFAAKMNEVAAALDLEYEFEALPVDEALRAERRYAAVMVAPQAAYKRQELAVAYPEAIVFEVPGKVFGSYDAPGAIRLLMHAFREPYIPKADSTRLSAVRDLSDDCQVLVITLFSLRNEARLGYRLYDRGAVRTEGALRKGRLDYGDIGDLVQMLSVGEVDLAALDAIALAVPGVTCRGVVNQQELGIEYFDLGLSLAERFGLPVFVDNNCNAAAVGCYVSQSEVESLVFYRHSFGHPAGGMGTVIDGIVRKGRLNFSGEPMYVAPLFSYDRPLEEVVWSAEGLHRMAACMCAAVTAFISPDALYVAVDTVDDADDFARELAQIVGEDYVPQVHIVDDYIERVYLGTLAMALQKMREPRWRRDASGAGPSFDRELWRREWERLHQR